MATTVRSPLALEETYAIAVPELSLAWEAAAAPDPRLLALNRPLAEELGLDPDALGTADGVRALLGHGPPTGATPVAQAYAGHQFGGYSPRLGDGRALLLGELVTPDGRRVDLHLKGSGRTPFARGGDGRAPLGPMLREHLMGEAMHALGVPTSRSLAVIATGERVARETTQPGAVLVRVAASHLRVGTFQYALRTGDRDVLERLTAYATRRHHPPAADAEVPALALLEAVVEAQAALVARWMHLGFVHGVMNTDNVAISGETIDYGPCAFVDAHDPATVFSSIDQAGRYAYGAQPQVMAWNLARLAEALIPLADADRDRAIERLTAVLETFPQRYRDHWAAGMRAKLGLAGEPQDETLAEDLLSLMHRGMVDHTQGFRSLSTAARGDDGPAHAAFGRAGEAYDAWAVRWRAQLAHDGRDPAEVAASMDRVNPVYVPRNHLVEEALAAASTAGDLDPFVRLQDVLAAPYDERPGLERYAEPAPPDLAAGYRTFCGT